jgi:hypothetical protein
MAETPYDIQTVLQVTQTTGVLMVNKLNAELLTTHVGNVIMVDATFFTYTVDNNGLAYADKMPTSQVFSSTLLSYLINEERSKGQFVFADGTIVYYDQTILD